VQGRATENLSPKKEGSVTAIVGAKLITWAFTKTVTKTVTDAAFAKAMQNRDRNKSKPLTFEERFPEVSRIKIL
jgi:hypothetical protein